MWLLVIIVLSTPPEYGVLSADDDSWSSFETREGCVAMAKEVGPKIEGQLSLPFRLACVFQQEA